MPETTFLQIQGRDQSASRVLELPLGPVRIGRGSNCEVRLGGEPGLGDVQCLLRRRGSNWHFQPVGPPGHVWIDGRPADHQRPLPVGSSLRVGDHWLTLRTASGPADARGSFTAPITVDFRPADEAPAPARPQPAPEPPPEVAATPEPIGSSEPIEPERARPASASPSEDEDRLRRWQSRLEQRERWLKSRQDERTWEARWKAAGETIRGRGTAATPPPPARPASPAGPASPPAPSPTPPSPLDRRPPARPAERVIEPRTSAPLRRAAEPARRPVPGRVPVRTPAAAIPATPRTRPEPPAPAAPAPVPSSRALSTRSTAPATPQVETVARQAESEPLLIAEAIPVLPVAARDAEASEAVVLVQDEAEAEISSIGMPAFAPDIDEADLEPEPFAVESAVIEPAVDDAAADLLTDDEARAQAEWTAPVVEEAPADVEEAEVEEAERDGEPAAEAVADLPAMADPETAPPVRSTPAPAAAIAGYASARAIFDASLTRPVPQPSATTDRRRAKLGPMPTAVREPDQWTMPFWLGGLPTALAALCAGGLGLILAWAWTNDALAMNEAVRLALRPEKSAPPAVDPALIPRLPWWQTTPGQLAAWAVALERSADGDDRELEVRALVDEARRASPLSATSRFVIDLPADPSPDAAPAPVAVGRTRDIVSMAWTGRDLRRAGKAEDALRAYRAAFDLAGRGEGDRPAFDEARQPRRFVLEHEGLLEWVARDMAAAGPWTQEQWAGVLPPFALAPLVAARAMLDRDRDQADRLLELAVAGVEQAAGPGFPEAEHRAAGAEALAARSRWTDAIEQYRRAIEVARDDAARRMWWVNLAEIAGRTGDEAARSEALEQAMGPSENPDEIGRRAQKVRDLAGLSRQASRP
ncbi:hypothetical protein TA3x_002763 [Tundrisphaera sp. TA3]|uniref:hypothetical protein n=1 Tax=Tundrisphaera sp. TA3 TaxID=3435775 RepID=UPI003EBBF734